MWPVASFKIAIRSIKTAMCKWAMALALRFTYQESIKILINTTLIMVPTESSLMVVAMTRFKMVMILLMAEIRRR